jgi:hypothetical protein
VVARRCVAVVGRHLAPGGAGVLQLGSPDQVDSLAPTVDDAGLDVLEVRVGDRGVLVRLGAAG